MIGKKTRERKFTDFYTGLRSDESSAEVEFVTDGLKKTIKLVFDVTIKIVKAMEKIKLVRPAPDTDNDAILKFINHIHDILDTSKSLDNKVNISINVLISERKKQKPMIC